jgi:hypothetical protein
MCLSGCDRINLEARLLAKTVKAENGCRVWTGALSRGGDRPTSSPYGSIKVNQCWNSVRVHIVQAYLKGLIPTLRVPAGFHVDHCCEEHGTMCIDCIQLIPAFKNLQNVTARPLKKTTVEYRTKPKRRKRRSSRSRVTRKSLPKAKK